MLLNTLEPTLEGEKETLLCPEAASLSLGTLVIGQLLCCGACPVRWRIFSGIPAPPPVMTTKHVFEPAGGPLGAQTTRLNKNHPRAVVLQI